MALYRLPTQDNTQAMMALANAISQMKERRKINAYGDAMRELMGETRDKLSPLVELRGMKDVELEALSPMGGGVFKDLKGIQSEAGGNKLAPGETPEGIMTMLGGGDRPIIGQREGVVGQRRVPITDPLQRKMILETARRKAEALGAGIPASLRVNPFDKQGLSYDERIGLIDRRARHKQAGKGDYWLDLNSGKKVLTTKGITDKKGFIKSNWIHKSQVNTQTDKLHKDREFILRRYFGADKEKRLKAIDRKLKILEGQGVSKEYNVQIDYGDLFRY